jgi:hypothetical protein
MLGGARDYEPPLNLPGYTPREVTTSGWYDSYSAATPPPPPKPPTPQARPAAAQGHAADAARRLLLSALFATALLSLAAGYALHSPSLRVGGLLGAAWFGVGSAPLQLSPDRALATRLGSACMLGFATLLLVGSLMVLLPVWHPVLAAVLLGGAAAIVHIRAISAALGELRAGGPDWRVRNTMGWGALRDWPTNSSFPAVVCLAAGTGLWLACAVTQPHIIPGNGGFVTKISDFWFVGLALLVAALALAIARRSREPILIGSVGSLVTAVTLTPALVYGTPRTASSIKHIELVQAVLRQHYLDIHVGIFDAYSGLFSAVGWLCDLGDIHDSLGIATFWPMIIGLVGLVELRWLFGSLIGSRYRIWAAITLVVLTDAVGQDYFSPQSVGFVLAIGVFALALDKASGAIDGRLRNVMLLATGVAMAITHELSPFIAGGVLILMALLRQGRPRWAAALLLIPALAWALINSAVLSGFVFFSDIGNLSNFRPPKTVSAPGLNRDAIVGESSHALLLGILILIVLAAVGWLRSLHHRWAWAVAVSPAVGLLSVAFNPYGNEGIFRATLFGIPWLAVLAAHAVGKRARTWASVAFAVTAATLVGTFLLSSFGLDSFNVVHRSDLTALRLFEAQAPPGSYYLDLGDEDIPATVASSPVSDQYIDWGQLLTAKTGLATAPTPADVTFLTTRYEEYVDSHSSTGQDLYALWSPTSTAYAVDYGLMTAADTTAWRDLMRASPAWRVVYSADGTYLFRLVERQLPGATPTKKVSKSHRTHARKHARKHTRAHTHRRR